MPHTISRVIILSVAVLAATVLTQPRAAQAEPRDHIRYQQSQDVFYNGYTTGPAATHAQMYISPRPVPPLVGHTYHTYPPLYPHELMYHHRRSWYTYHPGAGWTRTKAHYGTGGALSGLFSHMRRYGYGTTPLGLNP